MLPRFVWNRDKAANNEAKHGVTFEEAASVFRDQFAHIFDDDRHSDDEYREIIIGQSDHQRILIASFTEREGTIRMISARKATNRERIDYESHKR